jgi:hypothetical protein
MHACIDCAAAGSAHGMLLFGVHATWQMCDLLLYPDWQYPTSKWPCSAMPCSAAVTTATADNEPSIQVGVRPACV